MSIATTVSDVLTVDPAAHEVDLQGLRTGLHRRLALAGDEGPDTLFFVIAPGSRYPLTGPRCRVAEVMDAGLATQPDIGLEAADRVALAEVTETRFGRLPHGAGHFICSHRARV